jgi:transposase
VSDVVLTEELWARLEPLLPVRPRRFRYPGRLPADDRAALQGIEGYSELHCQDL